LIALNPCRAVTPPKHAADETHTSTSTRLGGSSKPSRVIGWREP
jgi:hypothetical protein